MRPLWKGAISFGLVNIPVGLYSGTKTSEKIDFDMLRDRDQSPIHYKRVAEADGEEVPYEHIVKGYEYEKGKYVVLTPEDFQRVQLKSTQIIEIKEFVDLEEIEPRFFDKPYFLAPDRAGGKAYAVLRDALERTGKAGIAKVVIRPPREHLAVVKPLDNILVLETMHFAQELRNPSELSVDTPGTSEKELSMACTLVESMASKWKPDDYQDEYREALLAVLEEKVKSKGKLPPVKAQKAPAGRKVIDLVSILQESINAAGKQKPAAKKSTKHARTRRKAA